MTIERLTEFKSSFQQLQSEIYGVASAHGFHDHDHNPFYVPTALALIMTEVSESVEHHRRGNASELPHELADVVIRVMDLAQALGIDLASAIADKHEFNKRRPYKHGNKTY